jgi:hypothetical protein
MNELPEGSRLLYKVLSGSHATNLVTPTSDEDWRGVYQVPTRTLLGLQQPPETVEVPPDTTYWELGHFARLCLKGNPNIMELLWIGYEFDLVETTSPTLDAIRDIRTSFFTTAMIRSYLGWVSKERRILGGYGVGLTPKEASQTVWPREEMAAKLTGKRGSHLVRLLLGLKVALTEGWLPVYLVGPDRDLVMAIKMGEQSATQVLFTIDMLTEQCKALELTAKWPEPDPRPIEDIVVRARMEML